MYNINGTDYENPVMVFATEERAQLILDGISYRCGFGLSDSTEKLDELHPTADGKFFFAHPITQTGRPMEEVLKGVTSYTVMERPVTDPVVI